MAWRQGHKINPYLSKSSSKQLHWLFDYIQILSTRYLMGIQFHMKTTEKIQNVIENTTINTVSHGITHNLYKGIPAYS